MNGTTALRGFVEHPRPTLKYMMQMTANRDEVVA